MRRLLITGGTSALGEKLIQRFHKDYELYFTYFSNQGKKDSLMKKFNIPENQIFQLDFSQPLKCEKKLKNLIIDNFIHTAIYRANNTLVSEINYDEILKITKINFITPSLILKNLINNFKNVKQNNYARFVIISSIVSELGLIKGSQYATTKAALDNFVRSISKEEGRNGILINSILPGPVETSFDRFDESYKKLRQKFFDSWIENVPLNKLCKIEDIVDLVEFLISDKNNYITGQMIKLNGGFY